MKRACILLGLMLLPASAASAGPEVRVRPPLRADADDRPVPQPKERPVSELFAIVYNSWCRHLSPEYKALGAADHGALNVNAWDEVPDSAWFSNRMGTASITFEDILGGLEGEPPRSGKWTIIRVNDEGYTPKLDILDPAGRKYVLKFDLRTAPERNSGAERICTLIMHAAGYNVPHNTIVYFRREDLQLGPDSYYRDSTNKRRQLTPADLDAMLAKLAPMPDGRYRGMASLYLPGKPVGRFVYTGTRKDDPNDIVPHELRRELRGMYVIASWINHVDVGDKNALDVYLPGHDGGGFVRHYLLDFGSALGSGDFINGPYRVGHEYIFDGSAMGRSLVTLGVWRRPWDVHGKIRYPEVGYYDSDLFVPGSWKPNYPNLSFERMDAADAYWGAKIVTAFTDPVIAKLAEAGGYSRPEITRYMSETLRLRRDLVGRHWLGGITALEDFRLEQAGPRWRLLVRDLAAERGYGPPAQTYRFVVTDLRGRKLAPDILSAPGARELDLGETAAALPAARAKPDRYGRGPVARVIIEGRRADGGWALPVEVILGYHGRESRLEVLGWTHAPGRSRKVSGSEAHPGRQTVD